MKNEVVRMISPIWACGFPCWKVSSGSEFSFLNTYLTLYFLFHLVSVLVGCYNSFTIYKVCSQVLNP